jgi:hypothetical protein
MPGKGLGIAEFLWKGRPVILAAIGSGEGADSPPIKNPRQVSLTGVL